MGDMDADSYKRTLFFQKLSPQTTKASLEKYLSAYGVERCSVPVDNEGKKYTSFTVLMP